MARKPTKKSASPKKGASAASGKEAMTLREYLESLAQEEIEEIHEPEERPELWVSFGLGGGVFGLPVHQVREVLRVGVITRVPRAPDSVRGVTNMRGRVLAILDLRVRMGLPRCEINDSSRILVAQGPSGPVGLLVDQVEQMEQVLPSAVQEPPDRLAAVSAFSRGVFPRDGSLMVLLELGSLLQPTAA